MRKSAVIAFGLSGLVLINVVGLLLLARSSAQTSDRLLLIVVAAFLMPTASAFLGTDSSSGLSRRARWILDILALFTCLSLAWVIFLAGQPSQIRSASIMMGLFYPALPWLFGQGDRARRAFYRRYSSTCMLFYLIMLAGAVPIWLALS